MAVGWILSLLIPGQMIGLFTENISTINIGIKALHIISFGFVVSAVSVTCSGALEALEQGLASLMISLSRYVVIIIPAAWILSRIWGAEGVFYAFPVAEALTAAISAFIMKHVAKAKAITVTD